MAAVTWVAKPIGATATDQQLRDWLTDIRDRLESIGIMQTDDADQIDLETVMMPSGAGQIGRLVFRLTDSLQDEFPVFFSIRFFRVTSGQHHQIGYGVEVGTGTDGSGIIQGRIGIELGPSLTSLFSTSPIHDGTIDAVQSWACHTEGFCGFVISPRNWSGSTARRWGICLFIARTTSPDGTPTPDGVFVLGFQVSPGNSAGYQHSPLRYTSSQDNVTRQGLPIMDAPADVNGDVQLQRVFLPYNGLKNIPQLLMCPNTVSQGSEFEAITAGTTPYNFVALTGTDNGFRPGHWDSTAWGLAMRFE